MARKLADPTISVRMYLKQYEEIAQYMSKHIHESTGYMPKQMGKYVSEFVRAAVEEKMNRIKKK